MMQPKTSVTHYGALKTSGPHYEGRKNLREKFWLWDFKFFFGFFCFWAPPLPQSKGANLRQLYGKTCYIVLYSITIPYNYSFVKFIFK